MSSQTGGLVALVAGYDGNNIPGRLGAGDIIGDYLITKPVGRGTFAVVFEATHVATGETVALKVFDKSSPEFMANEVRMRRECFVHRLLAHPHIIHFQDILETADFLVIIMELVTGGELFEHIFVNGRLTESEARHHLRQILSAVSYLHKNSIIHRDLKPENILLDSSNEIRLIDFGLCNFYHPHRQLRGFCGSPFYAAPELVLSKNYTGPEVDIWSIGVVLFVMVCGALPFGGDTQQVVYQRILDCKIAYPRWLTRECCDLLSRIICLEPTKRISISSILEHPWLKKDKAPVPVAKQTTIAAACINTTVLDQMALLGFPSWEIIHQTTKPSGDYPPLALCALLQASMDRQHQLSTTHDSCKGALLLEACRHHPAPKAMADECSPAHSRTYAAAAWPLCAELTDLREPRPNTYFTYLRKLLLRQNIRTYPASPARTALVCEDSQIRFRIALVFNDLECKIEPHFEPLAGSLLGFELIYSRLLPYL